MRDEGNDWVETSPRGADGSGRGSRAAATRAVCSFAGTPVAGFSLSVNILQTPKTGLKLISTATPLQMDAPGSHSTRGCERRTFN